MLDICIFLTPQKRHHELYNGDDTALLPLPAQKVRFYQQAIIAENGTRSRQPNDGFHATAMKEQVWLQCTAIELHTVRQALNFIWEY